LPRGNAVCRLAATCLLAATPLAAQTTPADAPPSAIAPSAPVAGADALTPAAMLDAFSVVRAWVDAGQVPDQPIGALPRAWVARVVIRAAGRVLGEDTATASIDADAASTLRAAASRAIARAVARLEGSPDALRAARVRDGLAAATLSIELAPNPPIPIAAGVDPDRLDEWVRPGLEGLLVRRADAVAAATPGSIMELGRGATATLIGLIAELADDPSLALRPAHELLGKGYTLSLFRVTHAAQIGPRAAPLLLHRGGHIAGPIASTEELRELAGQIADHLARRAWPGVERHGLRGDLDPVTGRFESAIGPPFAQAFAAEALLRFAQAPGVDPERGFRARAAGEATLRALAVVERGEPAPWGDPISAAACLSALARLENLAVERSDELRTLRDRCVPTVREAFDDQTGFAPMVPVGARGVLARGLLALADFEPWDREAHLARADAAIRAAFREIEPSRLLTVMPDLGWADLELARLRGGEPRSAQALRGLRETVLDLELRPGDLIDADRDLLGGLVLDAAGSPLPTWQGLRPVALLASMLGDPALTPGTARSGEPPRQLVRLLGMLRFLRQLTAEERAGHMYADPDLASGGVRASLWDQRMPLAASALGLVALTESLESIERLGARPEPAAGRP
jgi:hypothetical protein